MRSRQLEQALTEFAEEAALRLQADLDAGAEVPFELASRSSRGRGTPLYCYRPLTEVFLRERWGALRGLESCVRAAGALAGFEGLDRYLLAREALPEGGGRAELSRRARRRSSERVDAALRALLGDVFAEQSDFSLREERLGAALERLDCSAHASATEVTLLSTLHGLTIASSELALAAGLTIARADALLDVPDGVLVGGTPAPAPGPPGTSTLPPSSPPRGGEQEEMGHLLVVFTTEDTDVLAAIARGREVLGELLRALRLFGDGRIALGRLAWARVGTGAWGAHALGGGGRPHGMLVVGAEQEDELRAFCNLVSRRTPRESELAWALARFEMGCERATELEGLSDHLLALRALLEPEDGAPARAVLAGRLAALCAAPAERPELNRRVLRALALERAAIAGTAVQDARSTALAREIAGHLRALLRDVLCGHLRPDLTALADELLAAPESAGGQQATLPVGAPSGEATGARSGEATGAQTGEAIAAHPGEATVGARSGEEGFGDTIEAGEILNVPV
jgi:hypothetical protein